MKWIITKDFTEQDQRHSMVGTHSESMAGHGKNFCGVFRALPNEALDRFVQGFMEALQADCGMNYEFQLLDDDGEPMVEGICKDLDQQDGDAAFEPLDTFAQVYGASTMMYRKVGETEWAQL